MDNSKTREEVSGGLDIMKIGNTEMPSRAYVGRFNFKGVDQGKRVGELSGGERGRLHWRNCCRSAVTSCCSMNQPTTWISKPCARWKTPCWSSRAARWLSRTTAGSLTVLPPTFWITVDEGKVEFFEGNFTEYEEYKKRTLGADALEPKRIKYKRIAK